MCLHGRAEVNCDALDVEVEVGVHAVDNKGIYVNLLPQIPDGLDHEPMVDPPVCMSRFWTPLPRSLRRPLWALILGQF